MVKLFVRIKNRNLHTGFISLDKEYLNLYYRKKIASLMVLTEDNEFLEEYYGDRLHELMKSAFYTKAGYLIARRNLYKEHEYAEGTIHLY